MSKPLDGLERRLRDLAPADLSAGLEQRIAERLSCQRPRRRGLRVALAAAACLAAGVTLWLIVSGRSQGRLDPAWRITATGAARYRVVEPTRVRLERGELFVESVPDADRPAALTIETPIAEATATGTQFYIGIHQPGAGEGKEKVMGKLTRVLVLAGIVTLANDVGQVGGGANALLAAEAGKAPVKEMVQANSAFAVDLYKQFAKENEGKNLFFSPYSVSVALAMTAEGARTETALEMGTVLRFPKAARRVGDDAQAIPWRTALIHTGLSALNERFNAPEKDPKADAIRKQAAGLRTQRDAATQRAAELRKQRKWQEFQAADKQARELSKQLGDLLQQIDQYELSIANALWGEKSYPFDPKYIETVGGFYRTGGVFPCNFGGDFETERVRINGWVEEQTRDRIKDLIPQGVLDSLTRLVLTNAIYFKGNWAEQFKKEHTREADFLLSDGQKAKADTMHGNDLEKARYGAFKADGSPFETPAMVPTQEPLYPDKDGFTMVELPYRGGGLAMVLLAPQRPDGLPALEATLSAEKLAAWIGGLAKRKVHVVLPKFRLETDYTLGDADNPGALQQMGMVRAFAKGADFSGMNLSHRPDLYISKVLHKAFVDVNEEGTEAAAATAVILTGKSLVLRKPFVPTFRADRPFLFLIKDKVTGSVLFMGRMVDPTGAAIGSVGAEVPPAEPKAPGNPPKEPVALEAELKLPGTFAISEKQIAEVADVKRAVALIPTLVKKINYLRKDSIANKDEIEELQNRIRESHIRVLGCQESGKLKQGIDLELILRNTGKSDVTFQHGGEHSNADIVVTGPGAVNLPFRGAVHKRLMPYMMGKSVTIEAGASHTIVLKELRYGKYEFSRWLIGEPGDYTVAVTYSFAQGRWPPVKARPVAFKVVKK